MSKSGKDGKRPVKPTETEAAVRLKKEVGDLKTRIAGEAQKIVHEFFPAKVIELTKMIEEDPLWQYPDEKNCPNEVIAEEPSKKRKLAGGEETPGSALKKVGGGMGTKVEDLLKSEAVCEVNDFVVSQQNLLKKEIQICLSHVTKVKIWIQLNIPKVEDGNNFGVSVQEETVNELSRAEDTSFALLDSMNKYFMTRAKLVSRVVKYPGLRDYTVSVQEIDRKERINMSLSLNDLRNNYAIMYDTITKNLEKINNPRSQQSLPFT
uniref:Proteasome activator PA28 C-terminal domain-containing protein n=1 Tax=Hemiselmis andersenii TaxID=464988 RepID=A0A6U5BLX5_HEMAN